MGIGWKFWEEIILFLHAASTIRGLSDLVAGHVAQLRIAAHLLDPELPLQDSDTEILHHEGNNHIESMN